MNKKILLLLCFSLAFSTICIAESVATKGQTRTTWGRDVEHREEGVEYKDVVGILESNSGNEGVRCWNDCIPNCRIVDDGIRLVQIVRVCIASHWMNSLLGNESVRLS